MGRPRKIQEPQNEIPATEREIAPVTETPLEQIAPVFAPAQTSPRQMQVERQGDRSEPYTRRFPQVRGGICEFCGVLDGNVPSQFQYKLCPHYRGMQLRCSYCPETKDPNEVIYHSVLNIAESPTNPNALVVWCDSYDCGKAHIERFQRNRA